MPAVARPVGWSFRRTADRSCKTEFVSDVRARNRTNDESAVSTLRHHARLIKKNGLPKDAGSGRTPSPRLCRRRHRRKPADYRAVGLSADRDGNYRLPPPRPSCSMNRRASFDGRAIAVGPG
jgi:hypothetical protein